MRKLLLALIITLNTPFKLNLYYLIITFLQPDKTLI